MHCDNRLKPDSSSSYKTVLRGKRDGLKALSYVKYTFNSFRKSEVFIGDAIQTTDFFSGHFINA